MIVSDQTGLVSKSQRLIIKIGSALLVDSDTEKYAITGSRKWPMILPI